MNISLDASELVMAANVGVRRHAQALMKKFTDKHGAKEDNGWQLHIEGACGELAFAKAMNWHWSGSLYTFKNPDVGEIQVRTRSKHEYDLIIRKGEVGTYVLVTGLAPRYTVHGWFNALNVRDEWLKKHGNREEAWFIPKSELHPITTLSSNAISFPN